MDRSVIFTISGLHMLSASVVDWLADQTRPLIILLSEVKAKFAYDWAQLETCTVANRMVSYHP